METTNDKFYDLTGKTGPEWLLAHAQELLANVDWRRIEEMSVKEGGVLQIDIRVGMDPKIKISDSI